MMYLDVHTSRHDRLDVYVYYMMMRHRSRRDENLVQNLVDNTCLLYTSPSPRDRTRSRMPSSA